MTKEKTMTEIHQNFLNGNKKDAIRQVQEYGMYGFFEDYKKYLEEYYAYPYEAYEDFSDFVIAYFHIVFK